MRTMASVWFSVIVLISVQKVFGNVCLKDENKLTCNECIRCAGAWCTERGSKHCDFEMADEWCPASRENLHAVKEVTRDGVDIHPVYAERTLYIRKPNKLEISYSAKGKQEPELKMIQSTQSFNIDLTEFTECSGNVCKTSIQATASTDFCNATGGISEYIVVTVNVGLSEEARIKYFVPCACPCSERVEVASAYCNNKGNYSCGACSCDPGWTGEFCETSNKTVCDNKRGDLVQCSHDGDCSGNGYCGPCETCVCYTDREGSQYFDQWNNCADLCMATVADDDCEDCLTNKTLGECAECNYLTKQKYNQSWTEERDYDNRKIWVSCNQTFDDCGPIQYYARRDESGRTYVMVVKHCNEVISEKLVPGETKVPIILGILGIVAAVAAVGGVMLWKHLNTVPPVPLNDPQYQNIDAEDCTGENPLYKPPTSSFKNPTYGKW